METITLKVDKSITMTFKELALKIAEMHKWNPQRVDEKDGVLYYTEDGNFFMMDQEGFCYECDKDGNYLGTSYTEMVDFEDELDSVKIIWATDTDGKLVAILG